MESSASSTEVLISTGLSGPLVLDSELPFAFSSRESRILTAIAEAKDSVIEIGEVLGLRSGLEERSMNELVRVCPESQTGLTTNIRK
jgi:hypothetical protein